MDPLPRFALADYPGSKNTGAGSPHTSRDDEPGDQKVPLVEIESLLG